MTTPDLDFAIKAAEPLRFAASPHIAFKLQVSSNAQQTVHTVILKCQIQLDVTRRHYSADEQQRLADLFGEPGRWGETLRGMLWTNTSIVIPPFRESVITDLQIPCTFDFNVSATKYFAGLDDGDVPVSFFFNGTVFYAGESGTLQVAQIPWEKESSYRMPIRIWREMMDAYYPDTTWLRLERGVFDRLYSYKVRYGIPTFEQALLRAIDGVSQ